MVLSRRRHARSAGTTGFYGLVALGVVATVLAFRAELDAADEADARAADLSVTLLTGAFEQTTGALRGADVMALDGRVETAEFDAFASGVVDDSLYSALAYAEVVPLADRAAVEASGLVIRDTDGAGGFVEAVERDPSYVVVQAYPLNDTTRGVLGFDLAGEAVRRAAIEAAARSSTPVLSDRIATATGGRAGVSVVGAVRSADGVPIGFVTSGITIDDFVRRAGVDRDGLEEFALSMDGEALTGTPGAGTRRSFEIAGRSFEVVVADDEDVGLLLPVLIGAGTVALTFVVASASRRDRRQKDQLERTAERNRRIAELGQRLAALSRPPDVLDVLSNHAGRMLEASSVRVVDADRTDRAPDDPGDECIARREAVVDRGAPSVGGSSIAVPLMFGGGVCAGAIMFGWDRPLSASDADELLIAATTIAELASRSLERAVTTDEVQSRAERLSSFAHTLAGARTSDDVQVAVRRQVAGTVGADTVELRLEPDAEPEAEWVPVVAPGEALLGYLVAGWPSGARSGPTLRAVMGTAAELIGQTLARTRATEQEHRVIVELQRDLLPEPPPVAGFDIAVDYRPAMSVVGLGGDFYDVVAHGDRVHLVIGDISGHGSGAVAAMAELTSVVHHQLVSDVPIEDVCAQADLLLARRHMLATAQIVEIDLELGELHIVNAGHPYPVVRRRDGSTELLRAGHRPLLGLAGRGPSASSPGRSPFGSGDVLVLYTDGLVERRTQPIDDSMDDLAHQVGVTRHRSMHDLAGALLDQRSTFDDGIDDDVALLVVQRLS